MPIQIIPNLVQGVSQQATQNRRDAQAESQFDTVNSVLEGVAARPHADLIKFWPGRVLAGALFSETFHGIEENYVTGVGPSGAPFAIDLEDGTDCTVTNTAPDLSYLTVGSMPVGKRLRAQVVDDFTFIANREKTIAMTGATSPAKVNEAIIFVRATAFNTTYSVLINGGVAATYTTHATTVTPTSVIASALATSIASHAGVSVGLSGSTILVRLTSGGPLSVGTSDGNGDDYMRAFNGEAAGFDKLPARAFNGMILKVRGEKRSGDDDLDRKSVV